MEGAAFNDRPAVIAVATADPLAPRTFSGYSSHMFGGMRARGVRVVPFDSRDLRWYDLASGALNLGGFARGRLFGRRAPRIRPNWYWSRSGFERFSRRLEDRLSQFHERSVLLQVGTHVRIALEGTDSYCVTDCTIIQALEAGEFSISQTSPRVAKEAIACQREVFASCRKVFTLSRWTADSIVQHYGIPADKVVVVGAGANLGMQIDRRIDTANPYILFVGMDWEQKGGPLLLEAFRLVRSWRSDVRLKIVGCTPAIDEPGVDLIGYLPHGDSSARHRLAGLYGRASCLVLLSRFDCFPNVLLEAQLVGVPVVTLRGQGRTEALRHGETGMLVDRAEPGPVADALVSVLTDELGRGLLGRTARRWAEERFTWPLVVDRVLAEMGVTVAG
jgi:alpha-maltose-1-phosphate synthase